MKKVLFITIAIILILSIIGVGVYFGVTKHSILSYDTVNVISGKAYWLLTANVNNVDESAIFTYNPSTYTMSDGTKIDPQEGMTLVFSKQQNKCVYQATRKQVSVLGIDRSYYILSNPARQINVEVTDGNMNSIILDGTTTDRATISDADGKGSVVIETQGALMGKFDCPGYTNVAIVQKGSDVVFYNKADYEAKMQQSGLSYLFLLSITAKDNIFPSEFDAIPSFDGTKLVGDLSDLGSAVFTVTADQDYFDSIIISPPEGAKPIVSNIEYVNEISINSASAMNVDITNSGSEGSITIKAIASGIDVRPTATTKILGNSLTIPFTLRTGADIGSWAIDIEACGGNQFTGSICDSRTISGTIVKTQTVVCGDGICQESESETSCPADCYMPHTNGGSFLDQLANLFNIAGGTIIKILIIVGIIIGAIILLVVILWLLSLFRKRR